MILLGGIGAWRVHKVRMKVKALLAPEACAAVGLTYTANPGRAKHFSRYRRRKLIPEHDETHFEDGILGQRRGASFELTEARLTKITRSSKGGKQRTTVFRGQMLRIDFDHRRFHGVTVIQRDQGLFNRFSKPDRTFQRIGLVDPYFEQAFEIWGTDQVEARYLLTPDLMSRLIDLETRLKGKKIRGCFEEDALIVALEGGNLFEAGSMYKPLTDVSRVTTLLEEIGLIFDVIDTVLDQPERQLASE